MPLKHVYGCKAKCGSNVSCWQQKLASCAATRLAVPQQPSFAMDDEETMLVAQEGESFAAFSVDDFAVLLRGAMRLPGFRDAVLRAARSP